MIRLVTLRRIHSNCSQIRQLHPEYNYGRSISTHHAAQEGLCAQTLHELDRLDIHTDSATLASLLRKCGIAKALSQGKRLHSYIIKSRHKHNRFLENLLVQMYGNCGALDDARTVFDKILRPNLFSWNILIGTYAQHGYSIDAFRFFTQMELQGMLPNNVTFVSLLGACSKEAALEQGREIHKHIIASGLDSDVVVGSALLNMYSKCGSIAHAKMVFDKMPIRNVISWTVMIAAYANVGSLEDAKELFYKMPNPNVVTWTVMISAYAQNGQEKEAFEFFAEMQNEGIIPNRVTFLSILNACTSQEELLEGKKVHASIIDSGLESDVIVGTALINMYSKCGSLENARNMFDKLTQRNVVTWNAIIGAYVQHGLEKMAMQLFHQMILEDIKPNNVTFINILSACACQDDLGEGKWIHMLVRNSGFGSDVVVGTALVNMYGKCGSLEDAKATFEEMPECNVFSWNTMISIYAHYDLKKEALKLFRQMQLEKVTCEKFTFVNILDACSSQEALAEGKLIHASIVGSEFEQDLAVGTALVHMYSRCGSLVDAKRLFESMPERNVVTWTVMITSYGENLLDKEAFQAFQEMQLDGLMPDKCTIISILSICADHVALPEGKQVHAGFIGSELERDDLVARALINMYGRCGSLEEVKKVFEKIIKRDVALWTAVISAYAQHGNGQETLDLFQEMQIEYIRPNTISFVSVLSACSHAGLVSEGCACFISMWQTHGITPTIEHYNCMIDLFGRIGQLDEVEDLIKNMPLQPSTNSWMALLGACRVYSDMERGKRAADYVLELDAENCSPYMLLSSIYAASGR